MNFYFSRNMLFSIIISILVSPIFTIAQDFLANEKTETDTVTVIVTQPISKSIQQNQPKAPWSISFGKIFWSVIIFLATLLLIRYLTILLEAVSERYKNLSFLLKRFIPIFRVSSWTFVIYVIIAGIIQPPIATLLAFTASAGIALGFAAQDILKNIFGGIMILLDRPFQVGDKIEAGGHYGEVKQIGLRTVRIVTPDDNLVSIPNGELMNQSVSNANAGEPNCQVVAEFFLPPDIDLIKAKKIAYRAAAISRYVYLNKPIAVVIKNEIHEGRSLLKMRLKAYVLHVRYEFAFSTDMTEIVIQEFLKAGLINAEEMAWVRPA